MDSFSTRLRKLRLARNLSVAQVAQQIGVPVSTYREWEYGRAIKGEPYPKLAQVLGVSLQELMTGQKCRGHDLIQKLQLIQDELKDLHSNLVMFF